MQSSQNYVNANDLHRIIQAIPELNLRKNYSIEAVQMLFKISGILTVTDFITQH